VGRGAAGEPLWPNDVVGSITHGAGSCAAVVMRQDSPVVGLGIDVARHAPLGDRLARRILPGSSWPGRDDGSVQDIHWDSVVFSAKEATFKAWFPLARRFLRFGDARLGVHRDGTIEIEIAGTQRRPWAGTRWYGRYLVGSDAVRTIVVVERT
jgi:4'-phosphopantetheinyl transferase EntD